MAVCVATVLRPFLIYLPVSSCCSLRSLRSCLALWVLSQELCSQGFTLPEILLSSYSLAVKGHTSPLPKTWSSAIIHSLLSAPAPQVDMDVVLHPTLESLLTFLRHWYFLSLSLTFCSLWSHTHLHTLCWLCKLPTPNKEWTGRACSPATLHTVINCTNIAQVL